MHVAVQKVHKRFLPKLSSTKQNSTKIEDRQTTTTTKTQKQKQKQNKTDKKRRRKEEEEGSKEEDKQGALPQ